MPLPKSVYEELSELTGNELWDMFTESERLEFSFEIDKESRLKKFAEDYLDGSVVSCYLVSRYVYKILAERGAASSIFS